MVPPFLAYYGVVTGNQSLLQAAYDQCRLYRQYLVDEDAGGMWKHIVMGDFSDLGHWTTGASPSPLPFVLPGKIFSRIGNGWAANGMLRVLGTIQRSSFAHDMKNQQNDLVSWVSEIHDGIYPHLVRRASGLRVCWRGTS